jgi:hypothetical protein
MTNILKTEMEHRQLLHNTTLDQQRLVHPSNRSNKLTSDPNNTCSILLRRDMSYPTQQRMPALPHQH